MKAIVVAMLLNLCFWGALALGQVVRAGLIPPWPTSGTLSPEMAEKYFVYLDIQTGEYIVTYPVEAGTDEPRSGRRVTFRFEPGNMVEPEVAVEITKNSDGQFVYDYTVTNRQSARRPLRVFKIVASAADDSILLEHPRWHHDHAVKHRPAVAPRAGLYEGPQLRLRANMGRFVSWFAQKTEMAIPSGNAVAGFRLISSFRPGITTAYCGTGSTIQAPGPLPGPVSDQLLPLQKPEMDMKVTLTIGPKWGGELDDSYIAGDFALGVRRLINRQRVSAESGYIQELLNALDGFARAGKAYPVDFQNAPLSRVEQEIDSATRLAFGLERAE